MKFLKSSAALIIAGSALFTTPAGALNSARHHDWTSSGVQTMVVGLSNCNGGGLNLSSAWRNRIDSALVIDCYAKHYDNLNYSGFLKSIHGVTTQNLGATKENKTESIKYT